MAKSSGCLKFGLGISIAGCLLLLVLLVGLLFMLSSILNLGFFDFFGAVGNGDGGGIDEPCEFLSDDQARSIFGGQADAIELTGLYEATISLILDDRVLADANDCWVSNGDRAYAARLALHQGGDAGAVFDAERKNADPQSVDQGNGVTVTREGYFGGDVTGVGDRAFCTGTTMAGIAGVLVQQGDRLLYVAVGPPDENTPAGFEIGPDGTLIAPEQCAFAQEVARAILG